MKKKILTVHDIKKAMKEYDGGNNPYKVIKKNWFVIDAGTIYPVKTIYAIATKRKPTSFNTKEAAAMLANLNYFRVEAHGKDTREQFESNVKLAMRDDKARRKRLANLKRKKPRLRLTTTYTYERNSDVVAEVRSRAKGICEECKSNAPFRDKKNNLPFLEVHHVVQLAKGGDDTPENARALCPNCHRQAHYG